MHGSAEVPTVKKERPGRNLRLHLPPGLCWPAHFTFPLCLPSHQCSVIAAASAYETRPFLPFCPPSMQASAARHHIWNSADGGQHEWMGRARDFVKWPAKRAITFPPTLVCCRGGDIIG